MFLPEPTNQFFPVPKTGTALYLSQVSVIPWIEISYEVPMKKS